MSKYLITITPDNGSPERDSAHTTVRVDTSTGRTRITELIVRSANDGGLAPSDLPAIDMDLLIHALTASRQTQPLAVEPATLPDQAALTEPAAAPSRRRDRKATTKTAPARKTTARKTTARKATTGKATAQKATTANTTKATSRRTPAATTPAAAGTRAYRRMPDPEQVMNAYRQTGTIGGVAEHFNVPRHTIAGWARKLRSLGYTIGRQ